MPREFLQTQQEIFESLRDSLSGRITKLTNFTDRSFNFVWTQAFSEEIRELQELSLVSELAGFVDYAGGPITEDDLEDLELENDITPERVNELMQDSHLDEFVKIVGVTRDLGSRATGEVTFTTQIAATQIPEGTIVTTDTDLTGTTTDFVTTESASTDGSTTQVTGVAIEAVDEGADFNVPANAITRVSNPPVGVTGATNPISTTGGEDRETNDALRERAKSAVEGASEGGTVEGIKAALRNNVDAVQQGDVIVDEFFEGGDGPGGDAARVEVIVDGGSDVDVTSVIEFSRPAGIRHDLIRPEVVQIGSNIDLLGTDIDTTEVEDTVEQFLLELGIGENLFSDQLIREIMLSDDDIINIDLLDAFIQRVTNETFEFVAGTSDYLLDYTYEDENGSITITDESGTTYVEGTDFVVEDQTGDGFPETIVWQLNTTGAASPDGGEDFFVDYDVTVPSETKDSNFYSTNLVRDEAFSFNLGQQDSFDYNNSKPVYDLSFVPFQNNVSIEDENTTVFDEDVDWQLTAPQDFATVDTFTFDDTVTDYQLSSDVEIDFVAIHDADENIFVRGTDYTTIDEDNDGFDDTIQWDNTNANPANGTDFFVTYDAFPKGIRWDQSGSNSDPPQDDVFTVTYDQVLYESDLEIVETIGGIIRDESGDLYNEDTEYILVDNDKDAEDEAIFWETNPATLSGDEEFYFTYNTEGDVVFGDREKGDPGTLDAQVN